MRSWWSVGCLASCSSRCEWLRGLVRTHGAAVALRPVFFVWSRAPLLLRGTRVKASPMMMKHVKGALDVVVKDDDAVATVGQDEGTAAGVDDRKSDAVATENVKSAAARWWLMAAWLLRCRAEEKRRARVVKLWLL